MDVVGTLHITADHLEAALKERAVARAESRAFDICAKCPVSQAAAEAFPWLLHNGKIISARCGIYDTISPPQNRPSNNPTLRLQPAGKYYQALFEKFVDAFDDREYKRVRAMLPLAIPMVDNRT